MLMEKNTMRSGLFRKTIRNYFQEHGRGFPWRETRDPYHILVSEIMLQQTQVERVMVKYDQFLSAFPDFYSLAQAPLHAVLSVWQGLGYNRRAIALQNIARTVEKDWDGILPASVDLLVKLPGIGHATASAIAAFAFGKPSLFIETNIRRVFLHFYFSDRENVRDSEILPLVEKTLDRSDPRRWYYALMDYGAMLKKEGPNPNRKSAHYQKQSPFQGSKRQIRGMVLKALIEKPYATESALLKKLNRDPEQITAVLRDLQKEGFIRKQGKWLHIASCSLT
jgi:A/G-specific adenine glycosylase